VGQECRRDGGEFRTLARGCYEHVRIAGEKRHITSRAVLEYEREPAGCSHTGNGRRRKRERDALPETGEFLVHALADELILLFFLLPFLPFFQRHEKECAVGRSGKTEQAEADDAGGRFDARRLCQQLFYFVCGRLGSL